MIRNAIVTDRWDRRLYAATMREVHEFGVEGVLLHNAIGEGAAALWSDAFALLHLVEPRLVDPDDLDDAELVNWAVMRAAKAVPELDRLRIWTQGDAVAAALACVSLRAMLEMLHDKVKTARRMAEALAARRRALEDDDEDDDEDALAQLVADEAAQEALERASEADQALSLRSGFTRAAREAERAGEQVNMWCPGGRGDLVRMPAEKRLALAKRFDNPRFAMMAELFGALEALLEGQERHRPALTPDELGDVELGRDLARVLPTSLMQLADPAREDRFFADYLAGRLPQLGRSGVERLGRGGVVCCLDNSISMEGRPEMLAKAIGLVLLHHCRRQGRRFHGIHFSDRWPPRHQQAGQPQLLEFDFSGAYGAELVLDFAEFFFGGGTNFRLPIDRALEILTAEHAATGSTRADIVFVTDGQAAVSERWAEEFLARMEAIDATMWGILLSDDQDREPLETLCRGRIVLVADLLNPARDLSSMFGGVAAP